MTKEKIKKGAPNISRNIRKNYKDNILMIYTYICMFLGFVFVVLIAFSAQADEIKFKFKSPSFSGVGTSAHYLTIENQEYTRKEALEAEIKALKEEAEREEESTTLARFLKNFESRIYAQLSRQLVEQLFGENPATEGEFTLFDNIISWTSDGISITLTIYNTIDDTYTTITIPIGDFGFN